MNMVENVCAASTPRLSFDAGACIGTLSAYFRDGSKTKEEAQQATEYLYLVMKELANRAGEH